MGYAAPRSAMLLGALASACEFASPGEGAGSAAIGDGDATGGTVASDSGDEGDETMPGPSSGATEPGSGSMPPMDGSAGDDAVAGGADVQFVDASPIDLGEVVLAAGAAITLQLVNAGDGIATGMTSEALAAPLGWAGGTFPGTSGTCTDDLAPNATCMIVIVPSDGVPGSSSQLITISYQDGAGAEQASAEVTLVGHGSTGNLLMNGSAEDGPVGAPPVGWMIGNGGGWTTVSDPVHDGVRAIYPGSSGSEVVTIFQDVEVGKFAETLQAVGLGLTQSGWARAYGPGDDDTFRFMVRYFDVNDAILYEANSGWDQSESWMNPTHNLAIPTTTHRIRLEISCEKHTGNDCSVWFDEMSLRFVYPPPA